MKSDTIPYPQDKFKKNFAFLDLYSRVIKGKRANWLDIYCVSGIYVIYLQPNTQPLFTDKVNNSNLAELASCEDLNNKWYRINLKRKSDIVYIGKGVDLKERIRALIRFGHGKSNRHSGGEWLWQIKNLEDLGLLISSCPNSQERGYEKWVIDKFLEEHNELPLCNRKKGVNVKAWKPEYINGY